MLIFISDIRAVLCLFQVHVGTTSQKDRHHTKVAVFSGGVQWGIVLTVITYVGIGALGEQQRRG